MPWIPPPGDGDDEQRYGLRRQELVMLDLTDFGPNPHVPSYQDYAAMTVRWPMGTTGPDRGGGLC